MVPLFSRWLPMGTTRVAINMADACLVVLPQGHKAEAIPATGLQAALALFLPLGDEKTASVPDAGCYAVQADAGKSVGAPSCPQQPHL